MSYSLSIFLVWLWSRGVWFGVGILIFAFGLALSSSVPSAVGGQTALLIALMLSIPVAAALSGALLDQLCFSKLRVRLLGQACTLLSLLLVLDGSLFTNVLEVAPRIVRVSGMIQPLAMFVAVCSAVLFCAVVAALPLVLLVGIVELVMRWFSSATSVPFSFPMAALRPLLIILCLAWLANSFVVFWITELAPLKVMLEIF